MRCPDCRHSSFDPVYHETVDPHIKDDPPAFSTPPKAVIIPLFFRCRFCQAVYYVMGRESLEQAYHRIMHEHGQECLKDSSPPP